MRGLDRLPGLVLLVALGLVSNLAGRMFPLNPLIAALLAGALVGNGVGVPTRCTPGVRSHTHWLEAGIVLMGAGVALGAVLDAGAVIVALVVAIVAVTIVFVEGVARRVFALPPKLASLLAIGASICGVSAIVAVAGSIDADDAQVTYASATILLFDALTIVGYPVVGAWLGLSDLAYGVWAGTTMFSTGPVTAAGFAYSDPAGQWAVLVKLVRNALIGLVALGYTVYYVRTAEADGPDGTGADGGQPSRRPWSRLPTFIVGFFTFMVLGNTVLPPNLVHVLNQASDWLFLVAFAGLGLGLRVDELRRAGLRPVLVVSLSLTTFSLLVLLVVTTLSTF